MDILLQKQIFEKHYKFFDIDSTCKQNMPIELGIECGNGWYFIIDDLLSTIDDYITYNNKKNVIKSKFLRKTFCRHSKFFIWLDKFNSGRNIKNYIFSKVVPKLKTTNNTIDFKVLQIKEKFGVLTVYTSYEDDVINNVIRYSTKLSSKVCEYCGSTVDVGRTEPWMITCCKKCYDSKKINLNWTKNK